MEIRQALPTLWLLGGSHAHIPLGIPWPLPGVPFDPAVIAPDSWIIASL